jgi:MFS family permease
VLSLSQTPQRSGSFPRSTFAAAIVSLLETRFNPSMSRVRVLAASLLTAARNPQIRTVELAWAGAIAAEWAHFVALGIYAYGHGGASAVGLAGLVRLLPAAVVAPFAASFGDRFPRERFILVTSLIGALALAASAAGAAAGSTALVYGFAAVVGLSATLFRPALQALLPSLARTPQELIAANGATSTMEGLGTLVGPLLAGLLVAFTDPAVVFATAAGLFLLAAALLARVRVEGRVPTTAAETGAPFRRMLGAGFVAVAQGPRPRLLISLGVAQSFVRGCLNVLIVVAAFRLLGGGASDVGYLTAAIGAGGMIGALGAMTLESRRLAVIFGLALVFWGLPIALLAPSSSLPAAIVLLAIVGVANSVEDVSIITLLQRTVDEGLLTRVLAVLWGVAMGAVAIGSLAAPPIVDALGVHAAFVLVGLILPLLSVATYRRLAEIDRTTAPSGELDLIADIPIFEPLPLAAKESLAASLVPLSVEPGERVIEAGEVGDSFYLVVEGELDIDAGGARTTATGGDYFGEIALLRDVPRTATVTARTKSLLYALPRAAFLGAVTSHSAAYAAGQDVAETRLTSGSYEPLA